ncbi:hypothetical protein [Lactiplantibacillus carotarum]|uniref:hypothetical protein n=1 Tax=Lactiplantibacillus carotarum TaxID=2993456 RepID=UPI00298EE6C7|nr:hypothetical protein [Lactiplantibacillus carotarum]
MSINVSCEIIPGFGIVLQLGLSGASGLDAHVSTPLPRTLAIIPGVGIAAVLGLSATSGLGCPRFDTTAKIQKSVFSNTPEKTDFFGRANSIINPNRN